MKRLVLAATAVALLSVPAFAADDTQYPSNQQQQPQSQQMNQMAPDQQAVRFISPSDLSRGEIRDIQQALNKQGFDSGHVDGVWGPETHAAVMNFQQQKNLQANGQLDQKTLSALGVQLSSTEQKQGASETTGSASPVSKPADNTINNEQQQQQQQ